MQFLLFWEEKFYASCTLKDKNFAPKQTERDYPMTNLSTGKVKYPVKGQNSQSIEICPSIKTDLDGLGKPAVKVFWYMGENLDFCDFSQ